MEFTPCPLCGDVDKMIWMLEKSTRPEDREAGSLIAEKLGMPKKESFKITNRRWVITYRLIGIGLLIY